MGPNEAYATCRWTLPNGSRFPCTAAQYKKKKKKISPKGKFRLGFIIALDLGVFRISVLPIIKSLTRFNSQFKIVL